MTNPGGGVGGGAVTGTRRSPASRWSRPARGGFRWFVDPDRLARWIGIRAALEPHPDGAGPA